MNGKLCLCDITTKIISEDLNKKLFISNSFFLKFDVDEMLMQSVLKKVDAKTRYSFFEIS